MTTQHSATAFFRQSGPALYTPSTKEARNGADAPRSAAGDPAPHADPDRPQAGQPERPALPLRHREAAGDEVVHHPELQGDLDAAGGGARHITQTIDALHHGGAATTYPLSHPLEGWHAAITPGGHQVVHRHDPDTGHLHVGYAGHNVADAEERLGAATGSKALPVDFHGGAEKDFDKLHPEVQEKALNTIDRLSRGEAHQNDHSLNLGKWGSSGWRSARADFLHRVTHRYEDADGNPTSHENAHRLFIGHIGPHNYGDAEKRLAATATAFFAEASAATAVVHTAEVDDYRMSHGAPGPENAPLHDPTRPSEPHGRAHEQINLDNPDWGGMGEPHEESLAAVHRAKGNPDAPVTIYRAVPHGVTHIRTGDWVSTSAEHARSEAATGGHTDHDGDYDSSHDWPVLKATVPAKHVHTDGNDINEWGYNGPHVERPALHGSDEEWSEPTVHRTASHQAEAAAVDNSGGVMVAFVPPPEIAEQLAREDGQPADDLHVTLAYLGKASDYTEQQLQVLPQVVSSWAIRQRPALMRIGGTGKFNNSHKGQHVLYAAVDIPDGARLHADLVRTLEGHGYTLPSEHGWTPHMTLAYVDRHFRFMPHLDDHRWTATEVVTEVGTTRHQARLGTVPSGRQTL